jgi:orotate phosphoribosyltransferase
MVLISELKSLNGYWKYEEGKKYLAKLTSGKISDTFVNTGVLTMLPVLLENIVSNLYKGYVSEIPEGAYTEIIKYNPDYVCSPSVGAITLGYELARKFPCKAIFTEPKYDIMRCNYGCNDLVCPCDELTIIKNGQELKRFEISEGSRILFAEDVVTTGKSTREMIMAVDKSCGEGKIKVIPYLLCLVNRSGMDKIGISSDVRVSSRLSLKIISLAEVNARTWDTLEDAQRDCPSVIEALGPKQNWKKLVEG